ncbi:hypothetical protein [Janthinobacterium sp. BJB446]|uniref:hypothetical protein n=1 Tax=Janthinobacterium sp. BJB446 TaxID=2048009 RepID=UPI001179F8A8|nr:hypothetical protein [Janthinobacterium sp. BJB446]
MSETIESRPLHFGEDRPVAAMWRRSEAKPYSRLFSTEWANLAEEQYLSRAIQSLPKTTADNTPAATESLSARFGCAANDHHVGLPQERLHPRPAAYMPFFDQQHAAVRIQDGASGNPAGKWFGDTAIFSTLLPRYSQQFLHSAASLSRQCCYHAGTLIAEQLRYRAAPFFQKSIVLPWRVVLASAAVVIVAGSAHHFYARAENLYRDFTMATRTISELQSRLATIETTSRPMQPVKPVSVTVPDQANMQMQPFGSVDLPLPPLPIVMQSSSRQVATVSVGKLTSKEAAREGEDIAESPMKKVDDIPEAGKFVLLSQEPRPASKSFRLLSEK